MKSMTCKQLGGACDLEFQANSFETIAEMSQKHGQEMLEKGDSAHLEAMAKMKTLLNNPEAMNQWMENKQEEFNALPDN